jgi:hypothetical protein
MREPLAGLGGDFVASAPRIEFEPYTEPFAMPCGFPVGWKAGDGSLDPCGWPAAFRVLFPSGGRNMVCKDHKEALVARSEPKGATYTPDIKNIIADLRKSNRRRSGSREWKIRTMECLGDKCPDCGVTMVLFSPKRGVPTPDNAATYDHGRSRLNPARGADCQKVNRLICCRCNQGRSDAEVGALSREELWRRSGRCPQWLREARSAPEPSSEGSTP